jgi:hypothetical protein
MIQSESVEMVFENDKMSICLLGKSNLIYEVLFKSILQPERHEKGNIIIINELRKIKTEKLRIFTYLRQIYWNIWCKRLEKLQMQLC